MSPRAAPGGRDDADPLPTPPADDEPSQGVPTVDGPAPGDGPPSALAARLASALARPFAGRMARPARLIRGDESGGPGSAAGGDAATYDEALRRAFRSAVPLAPARAPSRAMPEPAATEEEADSRLEADTTTANGPEGVTVAGDPPREDAPEGDDVLISGIAVGPGATLESTAPDAAASPSPSTSIRRVGGPPANSPAGRGGRGTGATAPDDLLAVPESVATAVDDFFAGVVRRVERRP